MGLSRGFWRVGCGSGLESNGGAPIACALLFSYRNMQDILYIFIFIYIIM